jgi:hypothetical protein
MHLDPAAGNAFAPGYVFLAMLLPIGAHLIQEPLPLLAGLRGLGAPTFPAHPGWAITSTRGVGSRRWWRTLGYDKRVVDAFRSAVRDTFLGVANPR